MSDRIQFLQSFFGALGAHRISISVEDNDQVSGTVIYDPSNPGERQDFSWRAAEADAPGEPVRLLATLLRDQQLLAIDKISVPRDELRRRYNEQYGTALDAEQFRDIIERLTAIRIPMVEAGDKSDAFFIHE